MATGPHRTFRQVLAHTAKCEKCAKHNKSVLYRCLDCSFPICTPCWNDEDGSGRHKSIAITEPPVILPPLPPNKSKKKDKPATRTQPPPKYKIPHARTRKNGAVSDSETDDEKLPDAAAEMESSKKQSMRTNTDHTAASSNDENSRKVHNAITYDAPEALTDLQYPDDLIEAADLLLGFFHAADTPMSASSATSTDSGLAEVLAATGTIDRRRSLAPTQQRPSSSLTSDPSERLYELNKHYSREDPPPLAPEEGDGDVDMNDYRLGSSFTPINARKETIRPNVCSNLPSVKSLQSLAKARKEPRKSPSDRFIHSRRPERPREASNDDRAARGMKKTDYRYEESDSDVEIVGARRLRHVEPSFGDGHGNADGREPIPMQTISSQDRAFSNNGAARYSDQYPTASAEEPSGGR
ncbi:hypothetical protein JMJ35_002566 [Cladonia borealis]|uniref:Uncharacterized protein n=1 Tax=Cladonia borealis TaxID=184061 RepID=A0AA39V436_9LECA|nr:hypothetical protein JMJ35_002566 [Cladonia borealis]